MATSSLHQRKRAGYEPVATDPYAQRKRTGYEPEVATDPYAGETTTVLGVELTEDEAIMCKIAMGLMVLMIVIFAGAIIASSF